MLAGAQIWPDPGIVGRELNAVGLGFYDPEGAPAQFKYQWYVNGVEVEGIAENALPPIFFQLDDVVSVLVHPFDGQKTGQPRTDSVRVTRGGFTLNAMSQEQAVVAGHRCEYVISVVPDLPQETSVSLSLLAGDTAGIATNFAPETVSLVPQQVMGLSIMTMDVDPLAQLGTRTFIIQGSMDGFRAQLVISLKVLDPSPTTRSLSLNVNRPQIQVRQPVQFSGELRPLAANAPINLILSVETEGRATCSSVVQKDRQSSMGTRVLDDFRFAPPELPGSQRRKRGIESDAMQPGRSIEQTVHRIFVRTSFDFGSDCCRHENLTKHFGQDAQQIGLGENDQRRCVAHDVRHDISYFNASRISSPVS